MLRDARVATIVLNYLHTDDTVACVRALERSTCLDQRIVVVDNAPEGPEHDRLRDSLAAAGHPDRGEHGSVTVIATGGNLGYAAGNNVGARLALRRRPEFLWIVNPDLHVEPDTLERLLATADAVPDAGAVGPRIVLDTDPTRIWFDGGVFDRGRAGTTRHLNIGRFERELPPTWRRDVDYVTGACLLLRADAMATVGELPEEYFLYFEETDYCRRLAAAGWRLMVEPKARAVHHKRSSGDLPTAAYVYYMRRNKQIFARRMGLDEGDVIEQFYLAWIEPWRFSVEEHAPGWLPTFDALITLAAADAEQGVTGRRDDLDRYPSPEILRRVPVGPRAGR